MHIRWLVLITAILLAIMISEGCISPTPPSTVPPPFLTSQPTKSGQPQTEASFGTITLTVNSLSAGDTLPVVFTCLGAGKSPPVSWGGIPPGSKSLVLIFDDPDAPAGTFTHWLVYNIPPESGELAGGQPNAKELSNGAQQGESSTGSRGYYPPCPPIGPAHHYIFHLYALDTTLTLPTTDRAAIDSTIAGCILAKTEFVTTFRR